MLFILGQHQISISSMVSENQLNVFYTRCLVCALLSMNLFSFKIVFYSLFWKPQNPSPHTFSCLFPLKMIKSPISFMGEPFMQATT